ncbi:F-box/LRR-repeat protein At5g02910 [Linum perenne]
MTENEASSNGDDRISSLPDEVLHEILDRLPSRKQAAKYTTLSKRWNHLWLSYPVLEFVCTDYTHNAPSKSSTDSFIASVRRKFSSSGLNYIKSVRIDSRDYDFIGAILDLIQNREPQEIHVKTGRYLVIPILLLNSSRLRTLKLECCKLSEQDQNREPEEIDMTLRRDSVIPTLLLNSSRLRTLKLFGCKLLEDQYKMINLRVLHLSHVSIDVRVLNSMIAAAPLLEELTLFCLNTRVEFWEMCDVQEPFEIVVGALHYLESLSLQTLDCLEIICSSELPSLKSLEIIDCGCLRDHAVSKLISKSPSLLSLRLVTRAIVDEEVNEIKIESPTLQILELWWSPERVFRIDAPRLVNVHFNGDIHCLHVISQFYSSSLLAARIRSSTFELSLHCHETESQFCMELKEFLRKVTRQFQFVQLRLNNINLDFIDCEQAEDDSPTPVIERVEAKTYKHGKLLVQKFLYNILSSCHPKYFSFHCDYYTKRLPSLEVCVHIHYVRLSLVRFLTDYYFYLLQNSSSTRFSWKELFTTARRLHASVGVTD